MKTPYAAKKPSVLAAAAELAARDDADDGGEARSDGERDRR